jgi:hypothetical protein
LLYQWKNFCRKMRARSQQRSPIHSVACAAKTWHGAQVALGGQQTIALPRTRSRARLRMLQSARNRRHQARSRRHRDRHRLHPRLCLRGRPTLGLRVETHPRQHSQWIRRHLSFLEPVRTVARQSNHPPPVQRSVDVVAVVARVVRRAAGKVARQAAGHQVRHQAEAHLTAARVFPDTIYCDDRAAEEHQRRQARD